MGKIAKVLTLMLLMLSAFGLTNSTLTVKGQAAYYASIHVTSPIQNETFYTNTIPLNVSLDTNVNASFTEWIVLYCNLDGTPHYRGGNGTQIGQFYPPLHSFYETTINVPNGNHLVWAQVDYFTKDDSLYPRIENLSQIVSFTVNTSATPPTTPTPFPTPTPTSTTTPNPSSKPTPTVPEFPTWVILPFFAVVILLSTVFIKKRVPKK